MSEVWKGKGYEDIAVTDAGVKVALPANARAFVCSVENIGLDNIRAVLNVEFTDIEADDGVILREDKAYTFVSRVETQPILFVTLFCNAGETAVANVSFS